MNTMEKERTITPNHIVWLITTTFFGGWCLFATMSWMATLLVITIWSVGYAIGAKYY